MSTPPAFADTRRVSPFAITAIALVAGALLVGVSLFLPWFHRAAVAPGGTLSPQDAHGSSFTPVALPNSPTLLMIAFVLYALLARLAQRALSVGWRVLVLLPSCLGALFGLVVTSAAFSESQLFNLSSRPTLYDPGIFLCLAGCALIAAGSILGIRASVALAKQDAGRTGVADESRGFIPHHS